MRTGCDLQSISELRRKPDLVGNRAVFTAYEAAYCGGRADPVASFAGILCAKEACLKSLFGLPDVPELTWLDIEIRHAENGRPIATTRDRLRGYLAERALALDVAISHSGDYAMATAIAAHVEAGD